MSGGHSKWEDVKAAALRRRTGWTSDSLAAAARVDAERAGTERQAAKKSGRPYAEPIDLDVSIDIGAPLPHLLTDGQRAVVIFHAGLPADPTWDGTTVTVVDPGTSEFRRISWVIFDGVYQATLGPPNDEALASHPLYDAGLSAYQAHEVHNSDLIATLEGRNRVHPHHRPERFDALRHLIITFHDETFECVCSSWSSGEIEADFENALAMGIQVLHSSDAPFRSTMDEV